MKQLLQGAQLPQREVSQGQLHVPPNMLATSAPQPPPQPHVHTEPEDTTGQARVRKPRVDKQQKTATVSRPPMDYTNLSDADVFQDSPSDLPEAQLMTTSQTSRSLPGTLQSTSHSSPPTPAVPQVPQLSAVSQAPRLPAGSLVPQLSAFPQAPRLPTLSQVPQLPAVSLASLVPQHYASSLVPQHYASSLVPQHYASSLVPQHSAAHSLSLLSTGSTSQTPQTITIHQVSRTTKWRRSKNPQSQQRSVPLQALWGTNSRYSVFKLLL